MRGHGLHQCGGGHRLVHRAGTPVAADGEQAGPLLCCVLGAAGAQRAPQPTAMLEGEALMHSVPYQRRVPWHLPTVWVSGEEEPQRVTFCFVSVMVRPLTAHAGLIAVQERAPRKLPELWPSCPCWQAGKGARRVWMVSCETPPIVVWFMCGSCGVEWARELHFRPPPRQGLLLTGLTLDAQPDWGETHCISSVILQHFLLCFSTRKM